MNLSSIDNLSFPFNHYFSTIMLNNQLWFSKEQLILKVEVIEDDDKFTDRIDYKVISYQVKKSVLS